MADQRQQSNLRRASSARGRFSLGALTLLVVLILTSPVTAQAQEPPATAEPAAQAQAENGGFAWKTWIAAVTTSVLSVLAVATAGWQLVLRIRNDIRRDVEKVGDNVDSVRKELREEIELRKAGRQERRDIWSEHLSLYVRRIQATHDALDRERDGQRQQKLADRHRGAQDEYLDLLDKGVRFPHLIDPSLLDSPDYLRLLQSRIEDLTPAGTLTESSQVSEEDQEDLREALRRLEHRAPAPEDAQQIMIRGNAYFTAGQYEEAVAEYDRALKEQPNDPNVLTNRGAALLKLDRNEEALASAEQAVDLGADHAAALTNRGAALFKLGRHEAALIDFDRAVRTGGEHPETLHNRGVALSQLGRDDEAIHEFTRELELAPDNPHALLRRGIALSAIDRHDEALRDLTRVIGLGIRDRDSLLARGMALLGLKCYEDALSDLTEALGLRPDDATVLTRRGIALTGLGQHEQALGNFERALHLRPNDIFALFNMGLAFQQLGQHEQSFDAFDQLDRLEPDNPDVLVHRGVALHNLGSHSQARADYDRALEVHPGHPAALFNRACLAALGRKPDEAIEDLRRAIAGDARWRNKARTDPDFENIREDPRFRELTAPDEPEEEPPSEAAGGAE